MIEEFQISRQSLFETRASLVAGQPMSAGLISSVTMALKGKQTLSPVPRLSWTKAMPSYASGAAQ